MARQQQPERGPVAINEVVTAALDIAAMRSGRAASRWRWISRDDIPPILADADQLHQVLLNLIINAQQSLQDRPAPRRIRVTSCFDSLADMVRITVADNGPGIPEHLRARVFEPYFTTKPTGVGTGVGLAVSLGIVEAHGGTLTVDCPIEGGAAFTITLPVGSVDAHVADAEPQPKPNAGQRTILVVDDEPEIRDTLAEILEGAQHRVVTANSGREALERMAAERYDVILTDIRMPDLDGRALYREIEQRWPGQTSRVDLRHRRYARHGAARVRRRERPSGHREAVPAERGASRRRRARSKRAIASLGRRTMRVALGLKARTGRAAFVAVGGDVRDPRFVLRGEMKLLPEGAFAPYHAAAELEPPAARESVEQSIAVAHRLAAAGIGDAARRLAESGHELCGCGVLVRHRHAGLEHR